jgi:hypothetical protein
MLVGEISLLGRSIIASAAQMNKAAQKPSTAENP